MPKRCAGYYFICYSLSFSKIHILQNTHITFLILVGALLYWELQWRRVHANANVCCSPQLKCHSTLHTPARVVMVTASTAEPINRGVTREPCQMFHILHRMLLKIGIALHQTRMGYVVCTGWVKKKWDLKKIQIALTHSILKLKSIVIALNQMSQSGEKHAQD